MWHSVKMLTRLLLILLPLSTATQAATDIHHIVFVWLKTDASSQQLEATIQATRSLADIPGVEDFKVAKAIASERAAVDDSFSFGITMRFKSHDDMQTYLADDIHQAYLRDHIKGKASKVVIHDF
jgi:hypothetical protein